MLHGGLVKTLLKACFSWKHVFQNRSFYNTSEIELTFRIYDCIYGVEHLRPLSISHWRFIYFASYLDNGPPNCLVTNSQACPPLFRRQKTFRSDSSCFAYVLQLGLLPSKVVSQARPCVLVCI